MVLINRYLGTLNYNICNSLIRKAIDFPAANISPIGPVYNNIDDGFFSKRHLIKSKKVNEVVIVKHTREPVQNFNGN